MTEAFYTPTTDTLIWKIYAVRVALRRNARQIPVTMWVDPPTYTQTTQLVPPKYIPVAALTPEMAISNLRDRHPELLIINAKQS